ncbi:MAG: 23S rRNA (guanosine(2251)-2'-O)-methyltransferase RlmB [Clostridia bacterium]|nr:23S rRNA (guanosine(2251)-2'-O)-methyltransferase RlmB [Clostridia bacterium]
MSPDAASADALAVNAGGNPAADESNGAVVGRNAVRELLKSGRAIDKIFVRRGEREGSITMLVAQAIERKIPVLEVEKPKLDAYACGLPHQGIVAMAAQKEYCTVDDILKIAEDRGEMPLIVIADGINDPNNLGAIIRCAEGAGAHGIIIPKRHAVGVSPAVTKASAGAVEHMAIAKVTNLASAIEDLKARGIWTYAAEAGGTPYYEVDYHNPCALVFGSEGDGVSRLVKERCDFVVSIPMYGQVNSLNVSTASAVIINEAKRGQMKQNSL